MKKFKALAAVAGAVALLAGAGLAPAQAATKKTLTVGMIADVLSFDTTASEFGNRNLYYQAIYDGLLQADPNGNLKPSLATKWNFNTAQTVLTMDLRTDVKFTDGTKLDAAAVVKSLNAFAKGKSPDASNLSSMKSAVAKDADTVVITLKASDPAFLNYLARNAGLISSPKVVGTTKAKTAPVGSGPYVLNKLKTKFGSTYTFTKNPNYWNKSAQKFETVVLKYIQDPTALNNALKAKQIDAGNLADNASITELMAAGLKFETSTLDWVGLSFVDRSGKLGSAIKNEKVRQAINFAFDRKALLKSIGSGYGTVTTQVFAPKSAGYQSSLNSYYTYNPTKAKALLTEAGYPNGLTLSMPSFTFFLGDAPFALIADQLKAVGITVKWTESNPATFFDDLLAPKYPAFLMFLEQSPNDWQAINFLMSKTAVWNPEKFSDSTSEALIEKIRKSNASTRPALLKQLNKYIVEEAWYAPFYVKQTTFAHNTQVSVKMQAGNAVPYLSSFAPTK
jgi:peptide/nickel transport system substrate-binding protein